MLFLVLFIVMGYFIAQEHQILAEKGAEVLNDVFAWGEKKLVWDPTVAV